MKLVNPIWHMLLKSTEALTDKCFLCGPGISIGPLPLGLSDWADMNTPDHLVQNMSSLFGCLIGQLPLAYLGLPLCLSKPRVEDFTSMLKIITSRLSGCATLLSSGDKTYTHQVCVC